MSGKRAKQNRRIAREQLDSPEIRKKLMKIGVTEKRAVRLIGRAITKAQKRIRQERHHVK
jgi:hypothetical protein